MDTVSGRPNRPMSPRDVSAQPAQRSATQGQPADAARSRNGFKKHRPRTIALAIVGLLVAGVLVWAANAGYNMYVGNPIESDKYQAVFLTNGQVYFGKLHRTGDSYFKLTDVFYLQASQSSSSTTTNNPQQASTAASGVQLIKLGNEVHGPEDTMVIDKSQVLFFENLKNDGKVVDSITKYQNTKK